MFLGESCFLSGSLFLDFLAENNGDFSGQPKEQAWGGRWPVARDQAPGSFNEPGSLKKNEAWSPPRGFSQLAEKERTSKTERMIGVVKCDTRAPKTSQHF